MSYRIFQSMTGVTMVLLTLSLFFPAAGCTKKAVIVSKGAPEEREGYKGMCVLGEEKHNSVYDELCQGDLQKIVKHSKLDQFQQEELLRLICGGESDPEAIQRFYFSLPDEVRVDLIHAFDRYGYNLHGYG